jgi:pimeloyl-ACP methyl ester carboxylesterase
VHGSEDVMVPPGNGRLLAERIPDADLLEVDAAHLYPTDDPSADRPIGALLSGA